MGVITLFAGWFFVTVLIAIIWIIIGLVVAAVDDHMTTYVTLTGRIEPRPQYKNEK